MIVIHYLAELCDYWNKVTLMKLFVNTARNFTTTWTTRYFGSERSSRVSKRILCASYGPRCTRIAVYFVLIIATQMHASSIAGEWSVHADIISVQISETPEMHGCARSRTRSAKLCHNWNKFNWKTRAKAQIYLDITLNWVISRSNKI